MEQLSAQPAGLDVLSAEDESIEKYYMELNEHRETSNLITNRRSLVRLRFTSNADWK